MQVDGYSLEAQKKRCEAQAEFNDIDVIRYFSDEGQSGKSIEGREEFKRMIEYIEAGEKVDYIIVFKLSRFGRNTRDILEVFEKIQDYGVDLICVEDNIDTSKMGKFIMTLLGAISEMERNNIVVQTMAGRKMKASKGLWNGGQPPYGYSLVQMKDEKGKMLKINEEAAEHVRMIYDLFLNQNKGLASTAKYMNDRGYRRKPYKNNKYELFTDSFVKQVLDNPVYMGKIAYERRKTEKIKGQRDKYHTVKQEEYSLYDGLHEAIISEEMWNSVHEKRQKTGVAFEKKYSLDHAHLLSTILKCPACGASMYGNVTRCKKKDGTGYYKDEFRYVCKHRKSVDGQLCTFSKQPAQDRVDMEVFDALIDAFNNDNFIEEMKDKMNTKVDTDKQEQEMKGLQDTQRQRIREIEMISKRRDALHHEDPMYDMKYDELLVVKEEIKKLDAKIRKEIKSTASYADAVKEISNIILHWRKITDQEKTDFSKVH
ncbi:site-specific DNA recombinase [Breznakia blatticola]|uniref:Site-specific DNA recombinase n=2 Tax=Breznakia blatticola TaxID=1754012 RepID=A0A4V3G9A0_9FIRM|nr:site-specific DNA recombinase [Breznakia blatticola]